MTTQELQERAKFLPRGQRRVLSLLMEGGNYSVADITIRLHISDPRSYIRDLRQKGFNILDGWRDSEYGGRYKVYYLYYPNSL